MRRLSSLFLITTALCMAQYKVEPAGPPPAEVPAAMKSMLQPDGVKVSGAKPVCEIWLRTTAPSGPKSTEESVDMPTIPHGSFLGVIRFTAKGEDRRGQGLPPGVYTLRYSLYPVTGDHLGVAPQRDFMVMSPLAADQDASAALSFDDLMKLSRKASGTPHPAVLSMWQSRSEKFPALTQEEDVNWVLHAKMGDTPVAVIVVGRSEH